MNNKKNNLLIITNSELLLEWDYEKNNANNINVNKITYGSRRKVWWLCQACNGSYDAVIKNRTIKKQGCPYCAGRKLIKGFNDLQSKYPDLVASEWDYEKNDKIGLKPDGITSGLNVKAWWHCDVCKDKYEMRVNSKTSGHQGCPYCAGKKVLKGYNDLQSCYPKLIESEWDWIKNDKICLKPDGITKSSSIKAWWRCSHGHSWRATVHSRTGIMKTGCPYCAKRTSKQEDEVAKFTCDYLHTNYVNMKCIIHRSIKFGKIYNMKKINPDSVLSTCLQSHLLKEIDIYIPELGLAIEYDGDYWHSDEVMLSRCGLTNDEAHSIKQQLCKQAGIKILFITEHDWLNDTANVKNILMKEINKSAYQKSII